ncbi:unnamed protein product [Vitrella brassicaformis CCMP3155]|uniref:Uncharacterized protein n=1 Tax=Vitrella brassicaformis (strain CCMP3155) TaxID=1169540 RepID=A0A0G4ELQ9_VITBC|nr:unnamed protein product [Vitrella brassicaformis CCMP3155]|eukprot:CEL97907.1 unnamed protein product [Vitrella brassicaformis CCMP3155]
MEDADKDFVLSYGDEPSSIEDTLRNMQQDGLMHGDGDEGLIDYLTLPSLPDVNDSSMEHITSACVLNEAQRLRECPEAQEDRERWRLFNRSLPLHGRLSKHGDHMSSPKVATAASVTCSESPAERQPPSLSQPNGSMNGASSGGGLRAALRKALLGGGEGSDEVTRCLHEASTALLRYRCAPPRVSASVQECARRRHGSICERIALKWRESAPAAASTDNGADPPPPPPPPSQSIEEATPAPSQPSLPPAAGLPAVPSVSTRQGSNSKWLDSLPPRKGRAVQLIDTEEANKSRKRKAGDGEDGRSPRVRQHTPVGSTGKMQLRSRTGRRGGSSSSAVMDAKAFVSNFEANVDRAMAAAADGDADARVCEPSPALPPAQPPTAAIEACAADQGKTTERPKAARGKRRHRRRGHDRRSWEARPYVTGGKAAVSSEDLPEYERGLLPKPD